MSLIKLFLGGNNLVFSRPERVWSVTSRLGTGKWLTLFYSVRTMGTLGLAEIDIEISCEMYGNLVFCCWLIKYAVRKKNLVHAVVDFGINCTALCCIYLLISKLWSRSFELCYFNIGGSQNFLCKMIDNKFLKSRGDRKEMSSIWADQ